ncbi:hypothetical protein ACHAPD_008747 [Fusarium lateritium]
MPWLTVSGMRIKFDDYRSAKDWFNKWKPSGDSVKIIPEEVALDVDRNVRHRVDRPAKLSLPVGKARGGNARGSSHSGTKVDARYHNHTSRDVDDEMTAFDAKHVDDLEAMNQMASLYDKPRGVKMPSLASRSSKASGTGMPSSSDPALIAHGSFRSEDSNDSSTSLADSSSDVVAPSTLIGIPDDDDSYVEPPPGPEARSLVKLEPRSIMNLELIPSRDLEPSLNQSSDAYYSGAEDEDQDQPPRKKSALMEEPKFEEFEYYPGELNLFQKDIASVLSEHSTIHIDASGRDETNETGSFLRPPYRSGKVTLRNLATVLDKVENLLHCCQSIRVTVEKDV